MEVRQTEQGAAGSTKTLPSLVRKLCQGEHNLEFSAHPREAGIEELKKRIDSGDLHLRFTDTQGGTELGFKLDRDESDFTGADFERRTGKIHIVGMPISLDYVGVRCIATLDVSTLKGTGRLELIH